MMRISHQLEGNLATELFNLRETGQYDALSIPVKMLSAKFAFWRQSLFEDSCTEFYETMRVTAR